MSKLTDLWHLIFFLFVNLGRLGSDGPKFLFDRLDRFTVVVGATEMVWPIKSGGKKTPALRVIHFSSLTHRVSFESLSLGRRIR